MAVSSLFYALAGLGVVFKSGDEDSAKSDADFFMKIDDDNLYAFADSVTYFFSHSLRWCWLANSTR